MSISISNNTSYTYASVKAYSVKGQVTLTGDAGTVPEALPVKQNDKQPNITGKLNSLEHSATTNTRPMFLKGVLQKMTDVKVRDLDIEQIDLARSSITLDSSQIDVQDGSLTYEQMNLDGRYMDLAFRGTFVTKAGDTISFDAQLGSSKVFASYAALNYQTTASQPSLPDESGVADQLDVAA